MFSHAGGDREIALELYPGSWLRGGECRRGPQPDAAPRSEGARRGRGRRLPAHQRARLVVARRLRRQPDTARGAGDDRPLAAARIGRERPDLRRTRRLGRGRLLGVRAHRARRRAGRRALLSRRAACRAPATRTRASPIFAIATDAPPAPPIRVIAEDAAGNSGSASWSVVLKERQFQRANITLPPAFLDLEGAGARAAGEAARRDLRSKPSRRSTRSCAPRTRRASASWSPRDDRRSAGRARSGSSTTRR